VVLVQGEQGHGEARRAEAALGGVAVHQGLLHRVQQAGHAQPAQAVQVFDGEQRLAVQAGHELDAGIHGPQAELTVHLFAEHHGAGAAVAFGAALLGAAGMASSRRYWSTVRVGATPSAAGWRRGSRWMGRSLMVWVRWRRRVGMVSS
jgi:hypothetical protein